MYCSNESLLSVGSSSALDRQLRSQVALALPWLRPSAAKVAAAAAGTSGGGGSAASAFAGGDSGEMAVPAYLLPTGIPRPPLQGDATADEQWERMALMLAVCCAGFVRYLLNNGPDLDSGYGSDD
jgi:hypothetical protein